MFSEASLSWAFFGLRDFIHKHVGWKFMPQSKTPTFSGDFFYLVSTQDGEDLEVTGVVECMYLVEETTTWRLEGHGT